MLLFNRYQYEPSTDLIGKGEQTRVYKALDKDIYLPVAVKVYRSNDPVEKIGLVQVDKFIAMDHPNICRYLHIEDLEKEGALGEKERTQVCVMELVPDGDIGSYYRDRRDPQLLRKMIADILRGLAYLHARGIVHRRLKPSNLLVGETTNGPEVKITDFGIGSGKAALRDARISSIVLEVDHMAPEQFNPRKYGINGKVSYHIDFWGLGLAIYEALTDNDTLFKNHPDDSREQVIQNILAPQLPAKIRRLPAPFDYVVARCLAKHADERAQNVRELLEILSQPVTKQDDVYESMVLPAMARQEAEAEREEEIQKEAARVMRMPMAGATARVAQEKGVPAVVGAREQPVPKLVPVTGTVQTPERKGPTPGDDGLTLFNRYEYNPQTGFIGKGGFSRVYRALDKKFNRWVALKLYKTAELADHFSPFAEIQRVINLDHPNICRYLDIEEMEKENAFGEKETAHVCVMELLDGGNLQEYYLAHPGDEGLKKLLTGVLKGLDYLHKNGITHRDIKPENILIKEGYDGPVAKITDFGISKLTDSIPNPSVSALVVSIPYMAPEQLNVKKYGVNEQISANLDFWSLGVTIYEVITGEVLFRNSEKESNEQIMTNILAPELPEKINRLPQPFLDVVRRCVVKDARDRARDADELIELLNRSTGAPASRPVTAIESPVSEPKPLREAPSGYIEPVYVEPVTVEPVPTQPIHIEPVRAQPMHVAPVRAEPAHVELVTEPAHWPAKQEEEEKWLTEDMRPVTPAREPDYLMRSQVRRSGGRRVALRIAIVAILAILGASIYIYMQNQQPAAASTYIAPATDSTKKGGASSPAAPAKAPAATHAAATAPSNNDSAKTTNSRTARHSRRERKPAQDETVTTQGGGSEAARYVLLLSTPTTASITINNVPYGVLEKDKTMKVYLSPGSYVIQAISSDDPSVMYTGRLVVETGNLNQVGKYNIPLRN